ncbi:DUF1206 domain-containing protein [Xylanimonas sp. McL0601]|uniref:DUF1206 domain-containing protein n=1 Tax=Xylanimonas sp. McL0601 TaxID=3414739 RepID=UPI003CF96526
MSASSANPAAGAAREAQQSSAMQGLARGGYVASGVLHVLLGWLAVQLALGRTSSEADQSGAFRTLGRAPGGALLLWVVAVGFAALAVWQLVTAFVGERGREHQAGLRIKSAAKSVLYGVLAGISVQYASGGGTSGGSAQKGLTAQVLSWPGGRWLVGLVGLVIVVAGVVHVVIGVRKRFLRDLTGVGGRAVGEAVERLGQVGYVAKGIALAVVGGLVIAAGATADPARAGGLDEALRTIRDQPFGPVLLFVVGIGIAAYGVYSFARARYVRL